MILQISQLLGEKLDSPERILRIKDNQRPTILGTDWIFISLKWAFSSELLDPGVPRKDAPVTSFYIKSISCALRRILSWGFFRYRVSQELGKGHKQPHNCYFCLPLYRSFQPLHLLLFHLSFPETLRFRQRVAVMWPSSELNPHLLPAHPVCSSPDVAATLRALDLNSRKKSSIAPRELPIKCWDSTPMFIAAWFTVARRWRQPMSIPRWLDKYNVVHTYRGLLLA